MHTKKILSLLTVASTSLLALPAVAQMYPGEDVIVNPAAIPGPLLQPAQGEPSGGYTVHKPHHHKPHPVVAKVDAPAPDAMATAAAAPTAEAPPPVTQDESTPAPTAHLPPMQEVLSSNCQFFLTGV